MNGTGRGGKKEEGGRKEEGGVSASVTGFESV